MRRSCKSGITTSVAGSSAKVSPGWGDLTGGAARGETTVGDMAIPGDRRMTVREVASALGYQPDTIQGKVKELFPELVKNGIATLLTMEEVDAIKQNLVPRNLGLKSEVEKAITSIDIERMTLQVIQYHAARVNELESELAIAAPKADFFDQIADSKDAIPMREAV